LPSLLSLLPSLPPSPAAPPLAPPAPNGSGRRGRGSGLGAPGARAAADRRGRSGEARARPPGGAAAQRLHSAETATEIAKLLRGLSALDWGGGVLGDPEVYDAFQQLYDQVGHVAKRSALASRTAEQLRGRWLSLVDEVSELEGRPACLLGGG
ncbi:unnamed protein product, partial [Prorocentrum cordatum]